MTEQQTEEYMPQPVPIERLWTQADREECVDARFGGKWRISELREAVKNEPVFLMPLEWIDTGAYTFNVERGLTDFARHMLHVQQADLSFPIIMDEWGGILDGRHRIVKALLEGHSTIKAVRVPYGTQPTTA